MLEKAGYRFECIARKAVIKNGVILDDYRYSFLDEDLDEEYLKESKAVIRPEKDER